MKCRKAPPRQSKTKKPRPQTRTNSCISTCCGRAAPRGRYGAQCTFVPCHATCMYLHITGTNVRLLGSMHLFPASSRSTPPWIEQAYDWAEALVFESDAPTILPFLKADPLRGAQSLASFLSADTWTRLQASWPADGPLTP